MRQLLALLITFEVFFVTACSVPRPNTNLCVLNVPLLKKSCHNLKTDYDSNGKLLPGINAVVTVYPSGAAMLQDLNKDIVTDAAGFAELKAYLRNLRAAQ